jgi:hypothetical protein
VTTQKTSKITNEDERSGFVLTAERARRGFVLHVVHGEHVLRVRKRDRRDVERALRSLNVTIVDEWGARIDESQFAKEEDPEFNRNVGPGFWRMMWESFAPLFILNWGWRRRMRQSSDDG